MWAGVSSFAALRVQPPRSRRCREDRAARGRQTPAKIRFSVIGINHGHINGQIQAVQRGGGELVSVFAKEPDLLAAFVKRFPGVKVARSENEILDDKSIQLVVSAAIPDERAPLGVRVMKAGKDYMADKPGITTLEQLAEVRKVQAATRSGSTRSCTASGSRTARRSRPASS